MIATAAFAHGLQNRAEHRVGRILAADHRPRTSPLVLAQYLSSRKRGDPSVANSRRPTFSQVPSGTPLRPRENGSCTQLCQSLARTFAFGKSRPICCRTHLPFPGSTDAELRLVSGECRSRIRMRSCLAHAAPVEANSSKYNRAKVSLPLLPGQAELPRHSKLQARFAYHP